jgi:hypothetical protein
VNSFRFCASVRVGKPLTGSRFGRRLRLASAVLAAAVILPVLAAVDAPASAATQRPCRGTPAPTWRHIVWVVMENRNYSSVIGTPAARYINSLARSCGLATNYRAIRHPSLPNYLALTSGSTHGVTNNRLPRRLRISGPSIFSQVTSRSLVESMPSPCALSDSGSYLAHHNPQVYYTQQRPRCAIRDIRLRRPLDLSAAFTFIKPNAAHDMHSSSTRAGDDWLRGFIPKLLATPQYQAGNTAIFLTWDEGRDANHVALVVIAPAVTAGARISTQFSHYSLLATTESMLGVRRLGAASTARLLLAPFHL